MAVTAHDLQQYIEPIVASMAFEFVGLEYINHEKGSILRVYIDHKNGINVDHCADVSRRISAVLDVEDPISCEYTLEVSSPGLERPLFSSEHYQRFIGEEIKMSLHRALPTTNRKRYRGVIIAVNNEGQEINIELETDGELVSIPFDLIKKANLVMQY